MIKAYTDEVDNGQPMPYILQPAKMIIQNDSAKKSLTAIQEEPHSVATHSRELSVKNVSKNSRTKTSQSTRNPAKSGFEAVHAKD